jgi:hypothetical protein
MLRNWRSSPLSLSFNLDKSVSSPMLVVSIVVNWGLKDGAVLALTDLALGKLEKFKADAAARSTSKTHEEKKKPPRWSQESFECSLIGQSRG